ncbi:hypothetical protein BD809_102301 [Aquimarina intermedia]|uniref:Uncharacterized protein n=2 Tax=Flavobacteriaceae TaxID=49546 RepID=A0A5S5CCM5_9FLAO|nr:hypothetical protein BD809_102301 [Aquimarina intermedia]
MLKNILQLNGVQELNKEQKSKLSGGGRDPRPPVTEGVCVDNQGYFYFRPCTETCDDGTVPQDCPI